MNKKTDFGQFISEQKRKHSLQSQELAKKLGISLGYFSQLEHGKRVCPDPGLLKKMAEIFELTLEEKTTMYDLYAKASGQISPDICEYVKSREVVQKALRYARDANATDEDWEKFIEFLNK